MNLYTAEVEDFDNAATGYATSEERRVLRGERCDPSKLHGRAGLGDYQRSRINEGTDGGNDST